ncbi:uncharacterized protein LOC132696834 isoform X3 [Cylas formicarius]|uniref:uncharacterized protein LOC132696834 isoform X3 n=1 Tax=Cylas formicarius TaxID=197179 RepID=UPI002958A303|nr:uncharacterized protein LOC132696834 isoform X3 [Cylas formicarius]
MTRLDILWILLMVEGFFAAGSDYFKDPFVISHSQSKQYLDENGRLTKNLFLTEKFLLKRFATKAVLILSRKQAGNC